MLSKNVDQKVSNLDTKFNNFNKNIPTIPIQDIEKLKKKTEDLENINPLYFNNKLVRFAEEGSSGVTFSPSGDSIQCSSSAGGGACLNIGSTLSDTGKYEWIFKYEDNGGMESFQSEISNLATELTTVKENTMELQNINPLYHSGKLVRFAEKGSSGVTFSPSGNSITCSLSEGGGACLNVGSQATDTGKYEWIFKYEDYGGTGTGDVLFGCCNGKMFPSSWNLDCEDTFLWNPRNGYRYTGHSPVYQGEFTGMKDGTLRFVLDIDNNSEYYCLHLN
eukprot:TRINITY_DN1295_c0_g2_i5.p1 TRINITY_DN1295_c0_g2~~TRINITY_DN1295_c0_g2_i5.p1  ORF type:complete len:277 (-),score=74.45 TRINITY_DN1295_c0_g2_i5:134-964(-)